MYKVIGLTACVAAFAAPTAWSQGDALDHARSLSAAFRSAAEEITPSVVKITSRIKSRTVNGERMDSPFRGNPLLEEFFRDFEGSPMRTPAREGLGSGIVIATDGVILTNNHVVQGADEIIVSFDDGRQFEADADDIKTDPQTDLAIIRLPDAEGLTPATLGDSEDLQIGDWVIAVGHPFDYEQTVSAGIISGIGRELSGRGLRSRFIQTDAAINPRQQRRAVGEP